MNLERWKYLRWFIYGMLADRLIHDVIEAFSQPWTGASDQLGLITLGLLLLIFLVAAVTAWLRQAQRANSD